MFKIIYFLLIVISFISLIYNVKNLPKVFLFFIPLVLLSIFLEGLMLFGNKESSVTRFLFSIYTAVEYFILSCIIAHFIKNSIRKKIIYFSIPLFCLFSLFFQFKFQHTYFSYDFLDIVVESPLIMTWTLFYFFEIFF